MFCAENDMHQIETQLLRHGGDYMSGLQPSTVLADTYLGLRPRLVWSQAFGLHPMLFQPTTRPSLTQQHTNLSAKGAIHTNPGRRPR
jgi:hypothetical protein